MRISIAVLFVVSVLFQAELHAETSLSPQAQSELARKFDQVLTNQNLIITQLKEISQQVEAAKIRLTARRGRKRL
jgi:hypothetical protein